MPVVESAKATHTTLEVANAERAKRFYTDVMGLRTHWVLPKAGHLIDTRGVYAAFLELPKRTGQPFLNFYARPVADAAAVDAVHARLSAGRDESGIQEITAPAPEDPTQFGVGTYGFYLQDGDDNWWRIEENDGPFGPMEIPADAEPRGSVVPAGPISYVTLECRDLAESMRFYGDFLGLDVDQRGPGFFFTRGNGGVNMIVVERGDELVPQGVLNHHGITLWTEEGKIDELRAAAEAQKDEFGIAKIMIATHQHGSYSFYMQDRDTNWWEIEVWDNHTDPWTQTVRKREAGLLKI
jgi:catechol 2,3-dioxygenase-like lactoylglutathione lyase family enzyme